MRIFKGDDTYRLEMTASSEGDAASPAGDAICPTEDLLASPNFGICDTTLFSIKYNESAFILKETILVEPLSISE